MSKVKNRVVMIHSKTFTQFIEQASAPAPKPDLNALQQTPPPPATQQTPPPPATQQTPPPPATQQTPPPPATQQTPPPLTTQQQSMYDMAKRNKDNPMIKARFNSLSPEEQAAFRAQAKADGVDFGF
jgi:hypothetical protein